MIKNNSFKSKKRYKKSRKYQKSRKYKSRKYQKTRKYQKSNKYRKSKSKSKSKRKSKRRYNRKNLTKRTKRRRIKNNKKGGAAGVVESFISKVEKFQAMIQKTLSTPTISYQGTPIRRTSKCMPGNKEDNGHCYKLHEEGLEFAKAIQMFNHLLSLYITSKKYPEFRDEKLREMIENFNRCGCLNIESSQEAQVEVVRLETGLANAEAVETQAKKRLEHRRKRLKTVSDRGEDITRLSEILEQAQEETGAATEKKDELKRDLDQAQKNLVPQVETKMIGVKDHSSGLQIDFLCKSPTPLEQGKFTEAKVFFENFVDQRITGQIGKKKLYIHSNYEL